MSRKIKEGDWIYHKDSPWCVLCVYRIDPDRSVYWSSHGTSINIADASKLPAPPLEMAKLWNAAVAAEKAWHEMESYKEKKPRKTSAYYTKREELHRKWINANNRMNDLLRTVYTPKVNKKS